MATPVTVVLVGIRDTPEPEQAGTVVIAERECPAILGIPDLALVVTPVIPALVKVVTPATAVLVVTPVTAAKAAIRVILV